MNIILSLGVTLPTKLPLIVSKCSSATKPFKTVATVSMTFNCFFPTLRDHCKKFNNSVSLSSLPTYRKYIQNCVSCLWKWNAPEARGTLRVKLQLHHTEVGNLAFKTHHTVIGPYGDTGLLRIFPEVKGRYFPVANGPSLWKHICEHQSPWWAAKRWIWPKTRGWEQSIKLVTEGQSSLSLCLLITFISSSYVREV